jgi:hypothetical protein
MSGSLVLHVVSYRARLEPLFEGLALRLAAAGEVVERCQDPEDVVDLARFWRYRGRSIVRLDLYGHGAPGRFSMGDAILFGADGTGYGLARRLGPQLAKEGTLRLLGCNTGDVASKVWSGRRLLQELSERLGGREVWGTRQAATRSQLLEGPLALISSRDRRASIGGRSSQ